MSYQSSRHPRPRVSRANPANLAVGGWIEDLAKTIAEQRTDPENAACMREADSKVAPMTASRENLAATWNPTGYYTPEDLQFGLGHLLATCQSAIAKVNTALGDGQLAGHAAALSAARAAVQRKMNESVTFTQYITEAVQSGIGVIDAPGFRRYALATLREAESAMWAVGFVACQRPWWVSVLFAFSQVFDAAISGVASIVGAVITAGQAVLKIPDTIGTLLTVAKWSAVIGGLYYLGIQTDLVPSEYDFFDLKLKKA